MAEKAAIFACELYFSPPGCEKLTMFCHIQINAQGHPRIHSSDLRQSPQNVSYFHATSWQPPVRTASRLLKNPKGRLVTAF